MTTTKPIAVPTQTTSTVTTTTTTAPVTTTTTAPATTTTQKAPEAPKTGDELTLLPFALMLTAVVISTVALKLKKREN